jgi:hypothetical protein
MSLTGRELRLVGIAVRIAVFDGRFLYLQRGLRHPDVLPDREAELLGKRSQLAFAFRREPLAAKNSNAGTNFFNSNLG